MNRNDSTAIRRPLAALIAAVSTVATFAVSALPAQADDNDLSRPQVSACDSRYTTVKTMDIGTAPDMKQWVKQTLGAERRWGEQNLSVTGPSESGTGSPVLRVRYPEGTSSPSDTEEGGAGFVMPVPALRQANSACLRYRVRFEPNFDFVKGGKLPGLYGGDGPTGGDEVTGTNGFSMRFMWRKQGQGELYEYVVNKDSDYGESVGRGKWRFTPGQWVTVEEEIVLNDPDAENGVARVWIDGQPIFEQQGIVYRTTDDVHIDGLMFSTFFGGHGSDWRTPREQSADFADFTLMAPKA
ncbi:polysaccharide lyase [Salinicola rhizosphaerae]|uniref:Polysaccharide lyase 14 domain-containing protein n=1 Tax=Salinicola rhizosphaerae TaxID=1443141 RepID=A0ABQ3EA29_9GAMM|nr:hypothetical protein [Salinicola rhizosphaerae]GHB28124.1 hypothetical protein GCM10009038_28650 [Salinicola rhizosphaerae]